MRGWASNAAVFGLVWLLAGLAGVSARAQPQPAKIALLIGNQGYDRSAGELNNPHNDIAVVGDALRKQGFTILPPVKDARRSTILGAVRDLVRQLNAAGAGAIGFLYYSGHGAAESDTGFNYLIPVDAKEPGSATFWDDSLKLDDILKLLDGARGAAKFIVFDACRNELRVPAKSTSKGLMPVAEQQGMFIAYASAPGRTASDAGATSGPFAAALAAELQKPGQDHLNLFQNVKEAVIAKTGGVQQPWFMDGLVRRIYPTGVPQAEPDPPKQPSQPSGAAEVVRICREVEGMTSLSMLAVLERQHKGTPAADCISARMGELQAAQSGAPIGNQASVAEPSQPARCIGSEVDVAGSGKRCLKPKDTFEDCFTSGGKRICGPMMVVIPPGRFLMGTPDAEIDALIKEYPKTPAEVFRREAPQREVSIGRTFAVGETHVTRGQFAAFVTATGHKTDGGCHAFDGKGWKLQADKSWRDPGFAQDDSHPVVCVNWNDAQAYVAWIKQQSGAQYRLLSEAEAEYVARGVTAATPSTRYFFGNDPKDLCRHGNGADLSKNSGDASVAQCRDEFVYTAPAGRFSANPFGLKDVHGNAWSWTEDCYVDSYKNAPRDGSAVTTGDCVSRVLRGGSWRNVPQVLRSAVRSWVQPDGRYNGIGFRLAQTLNP